jgi:PAS domain S-box-containing protein
MELWRDAALACGYRALAAFPFAMDTGNAGVITYYASVPGFFDEEIIRLLEEQSQDISFALVSISAEEQRKRAEIDLKASELRYRRLFETAQDAILILDGDTGEIIDANKFILDLLGYPHEYFVGKHLWELGLIQDKSQAQQTFTDLKTKGYVRYEDLPLETRSGTRIQVEFVSNVYLVEGKKIIQCNIRDITERKITADALALASKKLSLMSSITRHDILNQLTVLKGLLYLSHDDMNDPVQMADFIRKEEDTVSVIERQITFTRDYQDMGVNIPFWQSVHDSVRRAGAALPLGNIRLENMVDNLEIFADALLEKVFFNIFDNALKYGGDRMTVIRVSSDVSGEGGKIVCEDDGEGISYEDKRSLFTKGFGKNTGLGLFLTREILSITGITITESGIPGKGARFEMTVPKGVYRFRGSDEK